MRAIMICLAMLMSGAALGCEPQDIKVKQFSAFQRDGYTRVVGEIENRCAEATGVQLQAIFRLKSGEIIDVFNFWPKSTSNLAAKESYAFGTMHDLANRKYDLFDITVVSVQHWSK